MLRARGANMRHGRRARLAEDEPGLQGSRLAKGEARRVTCKAPPIRHGSCRDTFPSGEGFLVARARAGLPYGRPRFAHACALRLRGERRRPPAEADGGCSGSSGHGAGLGSCACPCRTFPRGSGQAAPVPGIQGAMPPGGPARPRRASPNEKGRRPRGVTPASAARPLRAVPSRKLQGGPTRVQHDRRRATQSRAGCGHCPPPCHAQPQDSRTRAQLHRSPPTHS